MSRSPLTPTLTEIGFAWFHRLVAIYCLMFGLLYWVRLVGIYSGDLWRFDLMPPAWQVTSVTLAALFPFAAIGLWMLASWGTVVWFICAVIETFMYWGRPDIFGWRPSVVAAHLVIAGAFIAFTLIIHRQRTEH